MHLKKIIIMLVAALAVLAGCGTSTDQSTHNDADVAFAQGMIPHHRQAVAMSALAAGRTETPEILDLAARIGAAQGPEIDTMTAWLQEWDAELPAGGMADMDHGGMSGMDGMMTPQQMGRLEQSTGPAFDRLFLEQMTEHHEGAVVMARTELAQGADPDALALARVIVDSQQAEIDEMADLLSRP